MPSLDVHRLAASDGDGMLSSCIALRAECPRICAWSFATASPRTFSSSSSVWTFCISACWPISSLRSVCACLCAASISASPSSASFKAGSINETSQPSVAACSTCQEQLVFSISVRSLRIAKAHACKSWDRTASRDIRKAEARNSATLSSLCEGTNHVYVYS